MKNNDYLKNIAALEQAAAEMRPVAGMLATYFNALLESGFARSEALVLVNNLQSKVFAAALNINPSADEDGE